MGLSVAPINSAFALDPGAHEILCAAFKNEVFIFLQSQGTPAVKLYWPSQPRALDGSPTYCQNLDMGSEHLTPLGETLQYSYFPVCGLPTRNIMGFDYITTLLLLPVSLWFLLYAFGPEPARLLCPWNFPGKNTGVGSHSFLQGIFLTQGSNPGLLHWQQILYCLSHQGRSPYVFSYRKSLWVVASFFH